MRKTPDSPRGQLGPTGQRLDQFTSLGQRVFDQLRGMPIGRIEQAKGEEVRPIAMDVMRMMTLGQQLLEQWGFDAELPENVTPPAELEARRVRRQFRG